MAFVRYTTRDRRRFSHLYEELGLSLRQAAAVMGLTYRTAHRWAHDMGIIRTRKEGRRLYGSGGASPTARRRRARVQEAARMRQDGTPTAEIARLLDVSERTVQLWLHSDENPYYKQVNSRTSARVGRVTE